MIIGSSIYFQNMYNRNQFTLEGRHRKQESHFLNVGNRSSQASPGIEGDHRKLILYPARHISPPPQEMPGLQVHIIEGRVIVIRETSLAKGPALNYLTLSAFPPDNTRRKSYCK